MSPLDVAIASLAGSRLTLGGLLERLQMQARAAGLSVTTEEPQQAANAYRRRAALDTAADAHAWLAAQGLAVADLEASPEAPLLAARLEQHLTAGQVDEPVAAHRAELEQVRLAQPLAQRDELARQVGEGRDPEDLAREHRVPGDQHRRLGQDLGGALADELDAAARQRIQDELFASWPRMKGATFDPERVGTPG